MGFLIHGIFNTWDFECIDFLCVFSPFFAKNGVRGLLERYSELGRPKLLAIYKISSEIDHTLLVLWPETLRKKNMFDDFGVEVFFYMGFYYMGFLIHGQACRPCDKNPTVETPSKRKTRDAQDSQEHLKRTSRSVQETLRASQVTLNPPRPQYMWPEHVTQSKACTEMESRGQDDDRGRANSMNMWWGETLMLPKNDLWRLPGASWEHILASDPFVPFGGRVWRFGLSPALWVLDWASPFLNWAPQLLCWALQFHTISLDFWFFPALGLLAQGRRHPLTRLLPNDWSHKRSNEPTMTRTWDDHDTKIVQKCHKHDPNMM